MNTKPIQNEYFVYLLRCQDGSYYTGVTNCLQRRVQQHFGVLGGGAKYTQTHPPLCLAQVFRTPNRSYAQRWEYRIRHLSHHQKYILTQTPGALASYFGNPDENEICVLPREEWASEDRF
ncbi:MAG: GIY-YIG nuclease family protein [Clostridia bacterium]|nr:GIY-YIG nuclease family protein [Clostridia bacterium]